MNYGSVTISTHAIPEISFKGKRVMLASLEIAFVLALAKNSGVTLSKAEILEAVYSASGTYRKIAPKAWAKAVANGVYPEPKIVDVVICKTRRKMQKVSGEASPIYTVHGEGYNLPKATRTA